MSRNRFRFIWRFFHVNHIENNNDNDLVDREQTNAEVEVEEEEEEDVVENISKNVTGNNGTKHIITRDEKLTKREDEKRTYADVVRSNNDTEFLPSLQQEVSTV